MFFKFAIYENGVIKNNFDFKKFKFYSLNGNEVDGSTINGFYQVPITTEPQKIIPELIKCENEKSKMNNIIAGVSVLVAVITVAIVAASVYFSFQLFKSKKEYNEVYKSNFLFIKI